MKAPFTVDICGRTVETGELEKVDTQWADNRQVIDRVGAGLGEKLSAGLSAWKRGIRRPGQERLLERVGRASQTGLWSGTPTACLAATSTHAQAPQR